MFNYIAVYYMFALIAYLYYILVIVLYNQFITRTMNYVAGVIKLGTFV